MKSEIQKLTDVLSDMCLKEDNHNGYSLTDLTNATMIFSHFLQDISYSVNQKLPREDQIKLAETIGSSIRELIRVSTDYDMHDIIKFVYKEKN